MRTKKSNKKLSLNKKTIAGLNGKDLGSVKGGATHYTCQLELCRTEGYCDTVLSCVRCILFHVPVSFIDAC